MHDAQCERTSKTHGTLLHKTYSKASCLGIQDEFASATSVNLDVAQLEDNIWQVKHAGVQMQLVIELRLETMTIETQAPSDTPIVES